ncbi:ribosome-inactivating protein [Xylaria sp. FL1777]|nr:ribosome-inactivating protein [Xylaria sp. FL1777]
MAQTPSLSLEGTTAQQFATFILELRKTFAHPGSFASQIPALIIEDSRRPNNWLDIVLRTGEQAARLKLRRDSLYFVGFRDDAEGGTWYELNSGFQQIPASTLVGIDGTYSTLERAAGESRSSINLGRAALIKSVNQLATLRDPRKAKGDMANSLLVVIQMICESIRFQSISGFLVSKWLTDTAATRELIQHENAWGTLSEALIHANQDPDLEAFRLRVPNLFGIENAVGVTYILGILRHRALPGPSSNLRATTVPWGKYPPGRALVEVISVAIDKINGKNPGHLYGKIVAVDALGFQDLYNTDKKSADTIYPGQLISLLNQSSAVVASDSFTLRIDLWDKDPENADTNILKHNIVWDPSNITNTYDVVTIEPVSGDHGAGIVKYMVLSNAAEAKVEIILDNGGGNGDESTNIYGDITAHTGANDFVIFKREADGSASVKPGTAIPINKSSFAVPVGKPLQIEFSLLDHDAKSSDEPFLKGKVGFDIDLKKPISKVTTKRIPLAYGQILVKVKWF